MSSTTPEVWRSTVCTGVRSKSATLQDLNKKNKQQSTLSTTTGNGDDDDKGPQVPLPPDVMVHSSKRPITFLGEDKGCPS